MQTWGDWPKWLSRVSHSICSCMVGFVIGAAIFERHRFAEAVAIPAVGYSAVYLVCLLVSVGGKLRARRRNAGA